MYRHFLLLHLFMFCTSSLVLAQETEEEVQNVFLDSVVVTEQRRSLLLSKGENESQVLDMQLMKQMPQILGNADPIHYAQMLPGIQTNNEYQGGIHVQGCDNEHNEVSLSGVPIYNVVHLLGFFSTFNSTHYPSMSLTESANSGSFTNRLGAELKMQSPEHIPDSIEGEASAGLISSQGTLRIPLSKSSAIITSLRASYINLLYGRWMKADDMQFKYSFYDANITYINHLDTKNILTFDFYFGHDNAKLLQDLYIANIHDKWGNSMGALHWTYTPNNDLRMRNTIYTTAYSNSLQLNLVQEHYQLDSKIYDFGFRNSVEWQNFHCGAEAIWHHIRPQSVSGSGSYNHSYRHTDTAQSLEASLFCDYTQPVTKDFSIDAGIRGSIYTTGKDTWSAIDPAIKAKFSQDGWSCSLGYALKHQYLFQAGFSDMGLPTEFWFSADHDQQPQFAHSLTAKGETYLFNRRYQLSVSLYWKKLYHQVEYAGTVLDLINDNYTLSNQLLHGNGENYGINIMLSKCTGKLTGWVSYAYGKTKRRYPLEGMHETYPANHDRPHELDAVATYSLPKHWSFGATAVLCSGTPFTAPEYIFLLNGNLMSHYGKHNSSRLRTYSRIDVSVNYRWKHKHRAEQGINLSIYNLLCHNNDLFHYVRIGDRKQIYYKTVRFISPILPSVSYFIKL